MSDINFKKGSAPSLVASLLGFADATAPEAAGFRVTYRELAASGTFTLDMTVGDCLVAYCQNMIDLTQFCPSRRLADIQNTNI